MMEESEGEGYMEDGSPTPNSEIPGENWDDPSQTDNSKESATLTRDMIKFGLSRIARTLDTFEFAYSRFDCRNKNLNNIDILGKYIHLRIIDLGDNNIKSCRPLGSIQNLLLLNVESNQIESLTEITDHPFLQALCLRNNKITSTDGLFPNCLAYLQLGGNAIQDVYGLTSDICPWLTLLELKGNQLRTLIGIDLPQLQRIYLADNSLQDLIGIDGCPNLTHLHARNNSIEKLDGFPGMEKLEYVNLRGNNLNRFTQMVNLSHSPNIKTLILMENPLAQLPNYKLEALTANPSLRRLDKSPVLETDMLEARQNKLGREQGNRPSIADDPSLLAGNTATASLEFDDKPPRTSDTGPPTAAEPEPGQVDAANKSGDEN